MSSASPRASSPWYTEPWVWVLLAGPAAVIVAGAFTTVLALRSDDGLVADDYYRQGLAINQRLERDHRAGELAIAAVATFSGRRVQVQVQGAAAHALQLRVVHPTRSGADAQASLVSIGVGLYAGEFPREPSPAESEKRQVVLDDAIGGWRVTGTWNGRESVVRLGPVQ